MKFMVVLFLFFSPGILLSQDDHFYGTCGNEASNQVFFDGQNRYLAGTSDAVYNLPVYIIKTDTAGNVIWCKGFPPIGNVMQIISIAPDRLMILFDGPYSGSGLLTIDTAGNPIRYKGFQAGFHAYLLKNYFNSVVVSGNDFNNTNAAQPPFLAILDTASNWLYGKYFIFSNSSYNYITGFVVNADSSIYCTGGGGLNQCTFFKADASLTPGPFKSILIQNEEAYSIFHAPGNQYLIAGGCQTDNALTLTKINSAGTVAWQKKYRSVTDSLLMPWPFACLSSDGSKINFATFLLRYHPNNPYTRNTYALVVTDTSGALLYSKNYGDTAYEYFNAGINNGAPSIMAEGNHLVLQSYTTSNAAVNSYVSPNIQTDFQVITTGPGYSSSLPTNNLVVAVSTNTSVPAINYSSTGYPLNMYLWSGNVTAANQLAVINNPSQCTGISVPETELSRFTVFPNPNNGAFEIKMKENNPDDFEVKVYSATGELIFQNNFRSEVKVNIDLDKPSGLYFVEVISAGEIFTKKIEIIR